MHPPEPYVERRVADGVLWALPEVVDALARWIREAGCLHAAAAGMAGQPLRGRVTAWAIPAPGGGGEWVVRHAARGGAFAPFLGDRYGRLGTPRPFRELVVSGAARARGVPTPRVVAAAVYPAGFMAYRGDVVTERVPASRDLAFVLFGRAAYGARGWPTASASEVDAALRAAGRAGGALERAGVHHRDLNIKNLLLDGDPAAPRAWVLDLDRARLLARPSPAAGAAMRRRLLRSLEKWERRTGHVLGAGARRALDEGWNEMSPEVGKGAGE